ncbi:MAG: cytochrome C [Pseudomonadota bacterium]
MSRIVKTAVALVLTAGICAAAQAQDVSYRKTIRPLWQEKCAACHGQNSPYLGEFKGAAAKYTAEMKGPRMDTYADLIFYIGWPDTGAIMRRLDDGKNVKNGKPGNMYQYLGGSEEERQKNLNTFKQWVGADAWTLKRWNARGDVPGTSREELARIKVKY